MGFSDQNWIRTEW